MNLTQLDEPLDILVEGQFPPAELARAQTDLAFEAALLKARQQKFDALLERLYGAKVALAYQQAGKDAGVVHIAASNTLNLTVDRDSEPVWDQEQMQALREKMTPEERKHYLREKIEVPAAVFKASPPQIKEALSKARTLKVGRNKFTFKPAKEAQ